MINIHDVGGINIKTGQDSQGNQWTQFFVDYLAEQLDGECAQCGATIDMGWLCLDGGEEYCFEHVMECNAPGKCAQCEVAEETRINR